MTRLLVFTLLIFLVMVNPVFAQSASTDDDGGVGVPLPMIALVVVIVALVTRNLAGLGSRRGTVEDGDGGFDDDDDDDDDDEPRRSRHDRDEEEIYLMERDDIWEAQGYIGEDE